jgi:protein phosphatase
MKYFGATHKGKVRVNNEDSFFAEDDLFIVADGMGGHRAGEVASRLAVEYFLNAFKVHSSKKKGISVKSIRKVFQDSISTANEKVYNESISNPDCFGMGTTFTACYIISDTAYIIHVGDSRAYLLRDNDLELITSDHTFVGEMYRRGEITYEDTFDHPQRNYLTNVLGVSEEIKPDYHDQKIINGDRLLLCTDGLNSMLRDDLICKILKESQEPEGSVKSLIRQANRLGGKDNTTVVVIDF